MGGAARVKAGRPFFFSSVTRRTSGEAKSVPPQAAVHTLDRLTPHPRSAFTSMSPQQAHLVDEAVAADLTPVELAVYLVLLERSLLGEAIVASYDQLAAEAGASRRAVLAAANALVGSGLLTRVRTAHPYTGATDGPGTPYAWQIVDVWGAAPAPRWPEARGFVRACVRALGPEVGPAVLKTAALLAYVCTDGHLSLKRSELERVSGRDRKTAIGHLQALDAAGVLSCAQVAGPPTRFAIELDGVAMPDEPTEASPPIAERLWYPHLVEELVAKAQARLRRRLSDRHRQRYFYAPVLAAQAQHRDQVLIKDALELTLRHDPYFFHRYFPKVVEDRARRAETVASARPAGRSTVDSPGDAVASAASGGPDAPLEELRAEAERVRQREQAQWEAEAAMWDELDLPHPDDEACQVVAR
jgi:hypothetical protein